MTMTKERRRPAFLSGVSVLALLIEQIYCGKKGQIGALTFKNKNPKTQQRLRRGDKDSANERTRSLAGLAAAAMSSGVSPSPSAPSQHKSGAAQRLPAAAAFRSNSLPDANPSSLHRPAAEDGVGRMSGCARSCAGAPALA